MTKRKRRTKSVCERQGDLFCEWGERRTDLSSRVHQRRCRLLYLFREVVEERLEGLAPGFIPGSPPKETALFCRVRSALVGVAAGFLQGQRVDYRQRWSWAHVFSGDCAKKEGACCPRSISGGCVTCSSPLTAWFSPSGASLHCCSSLS